MIARRLTLLAAATAVAALSACGDQTQTIGSNVKVDTQAFQGTGMPYASTGWKQGDKTSWEQHLKTRAQQTQNEYTKVP
jgi:hypothetical protein